MEAKYKMMTQQLRMTHSDEEVGNYLRWVMTSDLAKEHWENELLNKTVAAESLNTLKRQIVETYRKFGDEQALLIRGGRSYTGNEIADEVEKETEFGLHMIDNMVQLTIDLVKRDKISGTYFKQS